MTDIKRVGDSGVHTVEGTVAGRRAAQLTKERDEQRADYELLKAKIKIENAGGLARIDDKFAKVDGSSYSSLPSGLITAEEIRLERERGAAAAKGGGQQQQQHQALVLKAQQEQQAADRKKAERNEKRKKLSATLSFDPDGDGEGEGEGDEAGGGGASAARGVNASSASTPPSSNAADYNKQHALPSTSSSSSSSSTLPADKRQRVTKDPTAETSFLPDRARDAALEADKVSCASGVGGEGLGLRLGVRVRVTDRVMGRAS